MNRVKELCIRKGIEQKELSLLVPVSQPTVSDWFNQKKNPSGARLKKLSEIFGVSRAYILGYEEEQDQSAITFPGKMVNVGDVVRDLPAAPEDRNHIIDYGSSTSEIVSVNRAVIHSALDKDIDAALNRLTVDQKRQALAYIKFLETQEE